MAKYLLAVEATLTDDAKERYPNGDRFEWTVCVAGAYTSGSEVSRNEAERRVLSVVAEAIR